MKENYTKKYSLDLHSTQQLQEYLNLENIHQIFLNNQKKNNIIPKIIPLTTPRHLHNKKNNKT